MLLCCAVVLLFAGIALLFAFFDINYYIRIAFTLGYGRLLQKKRKVFESNTIYSLCTTQDANIFLRHMNDARYLRELDFGRYHYYDRCGLFGAMYKKKGNPMQGATNIRYRRPISIFSFYKIETKLIYWDEKSLYLEQKFITLGDNFVRAIALSKQNIVGVNVNEFMSEVLGSDAQKPEMPPELNHWLQSIEISSAQLRKKD